MFLFPYSNIHELNLDWLLQQMIELKKQTADFININSIKYADPLQWRITTQYEANTVVINPEDSTAYLSVQPVPAGVNITNTEYWTPIGNFAELYSDIKKSVTAPDAGSGTTTPAALAVNDLIWWNNTLYKAVVDMPIGTALVVGSNVVETTISEELTRYDGEISDLGEALQREVETRTDADTILSEAIQAEVENREEAVREEAEARAEADTILNERIEDLSNIEERAQLEDITSNNITFRVGSVADKGAYYIAELPEYPKFYRNLDITPLIEMIRALDKSVIINGSHQGPYMINGVATLEQRSADALYFCAFSESGMKFRWIADGGYTAADLESMGKEGASSFSPIIENGQKFDPPASLLNRTISRGETFGDYIYNAMHSRTVIAEDNDGKFYFIIFSGRSFNTQGYSYDDMYNVLVSENIKKNAFNFDGGHSSTMFVGRARVTPMFGAIDALPGAFYID